jgi:hypothetical protein
MENFFDADEPTVRRAEQVIDRLVGALDELADSGSINVTTDNPHLFLIAYGWWASITRSSQAILTLRRAGLEHEASPIVRTVLQHGLALQWLVDTGEDAIAAVQEYADNNIRKLLKTMKDAKWPPIPGLDESVPAKPTTPNPLVMKLEHFEQMCTAYNAQQLYVPYRLLSAYAHSTSVSARAYIDETTGNISATAVQTTVNTMIIQTAMCLIQAGKAFSKLLDGDPLGDALAKADRNLGLTVTLWTPKTPKQR